MKAEVRSTSIKDSQCCLKGIQELLKGNGQQHRPNKCRRVAISMSFYNRTYPADVVGVDHLILHQNRGVFSDQRRMAVAIKSSF
uniref:Uncharacterized protein n=1 Tax=Daphnia galeata TaxID=27404 RepID=A0A8J2WNQ1_9CRUS|nr:unnamed protein product [Daphnia galeata]